MRLKNDGLEGLTASGEETKAKSFITSIERTWTVVPHNWESSQAWASPSNFISNQGTNPAPDTQKPKEQSITRG